MLLNVNSIQKSVIVSFYFFNNFIFLADRDWMAKNTQEKPQSFENFKSYVKNWEINECIIFEMWEEQADPDLNR